MRASSSLRCSFVIDPSIALGQYKTAHLRGQGRSHYSPILPRTATIGMNPDAIVFHTVFGVSAAVSVPSRPTTHRNTSGCAPSRLLIYAPNSCASETGISGQRNDGDVLVRSCRELC